MNALRPCDAEENRLRDALLHARDTGKLSVAAARNIGRWLELPLPPQQADELRRHVHDKRWSELEQAFWQVLPFGTAGRRGRMYPIGTAAINIRTIGESVQALANYLNRLYAGGDELRCAIAYDCRHMSREFALLSAEIMLAAGFRVWMMNVMRSTPQLALAVQHYGCHCGIMITASHNPPTDNAIKVFWSTGGQLLPPHDRLVMEEIQRVEAVKTASFGESSSQQRLTFCEAEMDEVYQSAVAAQGFEGSRELRIIYSPLHGVGNSSVTPILQRCGFQDVETFAPHATPDPDFPNVPDHVANPENPAVFASIVERAKQRRAELVLASDPDADRIGCAAPQCLGGEQWYTFTGNQIGALLVEFVLRRRHALGKLSSRNYVIRTVVSSDMLTPIAQSYGVKVFDDVLTGFKWIGQVIDREASDQFVFGFEEAHGYLAGNYIRDKDAGVAALLLAQRAAESKGRGKTLVQDLDDLYLRFGCFQELSVAKEMPGASGMDRMQEIMQSLRERPPQVLAGMSVQSVRDYLEGVETFLHGSSLKFDTPRSNLLLFGLDRSGFRLAIRPSGTEPKIKFYLFAYQPPAEIQDLELTKQTLHDALLQLFDDLMRATGLAIDVA